MTTRRQKPNEQDPNRRDPTTPAQEDEADILEEVGGERDDGGELLVEEDAVREVGAVDAASVRENRRMSAVVGKKRGGVKHVVFNTDDLLTKYEGLIKEWPPNTLDITVKRLTGSPITHTITSRPRSGVELYKALKEVHGQSEEAQYEVKFLDSNQRLYRGTGRITMPDTRAPAQQGQPMNPPNGAPSPVAQVALQSTDPMAMMSQMFEMFQRMQATVQPQQPQPQPQFQMPPTTPIAQVVSTDPMAMMTQMFEMFQRMQAAKAQPSQPQFPAVLTPVAPQSTDPMAMMSQMFEMFQRMQGQQAASVPPPPPAAPAPPPTPQISELDRMREMFGFFQQMQTSMRPSPEPYRGPRSPYNPQSDQGARPPPYAGSPPPQQRPQTAAEQFQDTIRFMRTATDAVQEMRSLLPDQEQRETFASDPDDDSPVRVFEAGPAKIVVDKKDGSLRGWETGWANMGGLLKWVGEQREAIQKETAARQQQRQQPPQQQLAPGYVEVGPGYRPPPGYVAIAVDAPEYVRQQQEQSPLPPPPEHMPPPIQQTPSSGRQTWGAPTVPVEVDAEEPEQDQ